MSDKSSFTSTDFAAQKTAKLRRLKIQENVIYSSLTKILSSLEQDIVMDFQKTSERNNFESVLKDAFVKIRNLLEDIKITINSQKNVENLDINEIKKDILDLEEKLKSFKIHLQTEVIALKKLANEIENELSTNQLEGYQVKNKKSKLQKKKFSEIIPSPVRTIIDSPFKCPEVQQFQEFLTHNHKRYGGWNEYNHNIFVRIWNKNFCNDNNEDLIKLSDLLENTERIQKFRNEIMDNIPGIKFDDITAHIKWYSEYVRLKTCQQNALKRWKENKRIIKKPSQEGQQKLQSNELLAPNSDKVLKEKVSYRSRNTGERNIISGITKPTEQWKNRCKSVKELQLFPIVQDKRQVRIPTWRLGLLEN